MGLSIPIHARCMRLVERDLSIAHTLTGREVCSTRQRSKFCGSDYTVGSWTLWTSSYDHERLSDAFRRSYTSNLFGLLELLLQPGRQLWRHHWNL